MEILPIPSLQIVLEWIYFITFHRQSEIWCFLLLKVLESWSWRIGRADCSRSSGSEWLWKVNIFASASPAGSFFLSPPSVPPLRPPEDRGGAGQGEADLKWDVGRGGAAEWPGSPLGGAEASREGGRQGPRGCYALQRLQPQLGVRVEPQSSSLNTCSSECIKDSRNTLICVTASNMAVFTYPAPQTHTGSSLCSFALSVCGGTNVHSQLCPQALILWKGERRGRSTGRMSLRTRIHRLTGRNERNLALLM